MTKRFIPVHRRSRFVALATAILLLGSACATARPGVETWQPAWEAIVNGVPDESVVGESPPRSLCNETLTFLRSSRASVDPTPDLTLDEPVREWIDIAEEAFFECPPRGQKLDGFAEAYALLARLEAEIDSVLAIDQGT
ncbi:MAG: hypothetical protein M3132_01810 [Actinomycetia bacterium]|nr:hypothetical protein [Actinomycetes bacterium]